MAKNDAPVTIAKAAALGFVFGVLAWCGGSLDHENGRVAAFWLSNALLLGVLFRTRAGTWLFYFLACFCANVLANWLIGDAMALAIGLSVANIIEVCFVLLVFERLGCTAPQMDDLSDLGLLFVAGALAPIVSGLCGALLLALISSEMFAPDLLSWVIANGLGLMIGTPIVIIAIDTWAARRRLSLRDIANWSLLVAVAMATCAIIFAQSRFPFLFLAAPAVILAAFRAGILGTAVVTLSISMVASVATFMGYGPITLAHGDVSTQLITLQLFLAVNFLMGLPVAAALAGKSALRRDLQESRDFSQTILANSREVIFRTDAEGRWVFLNPAWRQLTGLDVHESIGTDMIAMFHPENLDELICTRNQMVTGLMRTCNGKFRMRHTDGGWRHIPLPFRR